MGRSTPRAFKLQGQKDAEDGPWLAGPGLKPGELRSALLHSYTNQVLRGLLTGAQQYFIFCHMAGSGDPPVMGNDQPGSHGEGWGPKLLAAYP